MRVRTAKPKTPANGRKADEAGVDALTGVCDHAGFIALANEMFLSSQPRDAPLALAFDFDIDDAGRSSADTDVITPALFSMAHKLRDFYRGTDIVGRVGE